MSLSSVYAALDDAIRDGVIDLWTASADPALPGLRATLGLFGIAAAYVVRQAQASQGVDSVTLTGVAVFGAPGDPQGMRFNVNCRLTYVEDASGKGIFTLRLGFVDPGWTFSSFFNQAALPPTQTLLEGGSTYVWADSFLVGVRLDGAAFWADSRAATLHLSGFLLENAVFGRYRDFVKPWPLALSGTLVMPSSWTAAPAMTLLAVAAAGSTLDIDRQADIPSGPAKLALNDLGFELIIRTDLDQDAWGLTAFSVLNLRGTLVLGNPRNAISATLKTQLLSSSNLWKLTAEFEPKQTKVSNLLQLTSIFGLPALPLPDNFPIIDAFYFQTLELLFDSPIRDGGQGVSLLPTLRSFAITIGSDEMWTPPIPFIRLHKVGTYWLWTWTPVYESDSSERMRLASTVSGSVYGTLRFGGDGTTTLARLPTPSPPLRDGTANALRRDDAAAGGVDIDVSVSLPELFIQGEMHQGDVIPLTEAFKYFFDAPGPPTTTDKIANVTALGFSADPIAQAYHASADIVFTTGNLAPAAPGWDIDLIVITVSLRQLSLWVDVNAGRVGGGIAGVFTLEQGDAVANPSLLLKAEYPIQDPKQATGWNFSGFLYPGASIDLTKLVARFLGLGHVPPSVPHLNVDRLNFAFSTASKAYLLGGTISARWTPDIFGTELRISAAASVDIARSGDADAGKPAAGTLSGAFSINKISVEASMDVGVPERTYMFKVLFGEFWFQAVTSWRGDQDNRHQAISLQLGGVTLGEVLEYLVNLAAPTLGFTLDAPWDVLKRIDLSRFVLTLDPKENLVEFVFKANVDLTIMRIDTVGVRYTRGGSGKVDLILEGSFLGKDYSGDKALKWDVINEPPPAVSGQGDMLVDLRYLGVGQRIRLNNPPDTVRETVKLLAAQMRRVDDPAKLPGADGPLTFSSDSQWLLGMDVSLMSGTVELGLIFNDPVLYGLSVALSGERADTLAGLRFEILYKKISDTIGMFRIELRVPDAFRTFQLGVASFTLGTVVVEVYTNGNFMIDLGFPYNRNFERSFSLQAYVFIGRGGFYFGVLNGATSSRVPRIINGNFAPVLELGIGLAAGVGREIRAGILAGGAYVQIEVIFQGVLAWFNPDSHGTAPARYHWAQGIVAIHGKVYGYVDFKIIKVTVTLEAYAQASALFESYRPTLFRLEVDVRAEAEIKIVFFTISFSFHVGLSLDFALGGVEQTPWILAPGSSPAGLSASTPRRDRHYLRQLLAEQHLRVASLHHGLFAAGLGQQDWNWNPSQALWPDGQPRTAHLSLLPAFTVGNVPLSWQVEQTAPLNASPDYRAAFILCADSGVSAQARTAAATRVRSAAANPLSRSADDTDALTADLWVQVFLCYALYSIPGGPTSPSDPATAGQLALLALQLEAPGIADAGFRLDMLETLFKKNLHLVLSGQPQSKASDIGGMIAPLPPYLSWQSPQGGDIDFHAYHAVGPWYEWGIADQLGKYFPVGGAAGGRPETDDPADYESFAAFVFRDYCLMIARAAVKEARDLLGRGSVTVMTGSEGKTPNLRQLALLFAHATIDYTVRSGDTVASVAAGLGCTTTALDFLNPTLAATLANAAPGSIVSVQVGIAPEVLAQDNASQAFALATVALGTIVHQVAVGQTLAAIATLFNVTDVTTFFQLDGASTGLGASAGLLRPAAPFDYPAQTWSADVSRLRAAAIFFARYTVLELEQAAWYAQAIFDLNPDVMKRIFPDQPMLLDLELPPAQNLQVPSAFNQRSPTTPYTTVAGDTLMRIAQALALEQVYPASSPLKAPQWQAFLGQVTSPSAGTFALPAWTGLSPLHGESVEALCRRLIVDASWHGSDPNNPPAGTWSYAWSAIVPWLAPAKVLATLAEVPVHDAVAKAGDSETLSFQSLSETYALPPAKAATRLQDLAGLYPENTLLTVTALPVLTVQQLVDGVSGTEALARIVNQASRSLAAGLQLPALAQDGVHVIPSRTVSSPLYDLNGQQFSVAVSDDPLKGDEVALTLSVTSQADWITFAQAATVQAQDDLPGLLARHAELPRHSPGLFAQQELRPGMLMLTGSLSELAYSYTNAQILAASPATSLVIDLPELPVALPLHGVVPRTYGLDHRIELQAPVSLPIPEAVIPSPGGQPSLWPFPTDLVARAASGSTTAYEILSSTQGEHAARHANAVTRSTWGCLLPFKLRRIDASLQRFTLIGVDTSDRQRLLDLIAWLPAGAPDTTAAYTLATPAPNAGNTQGLLVLPMLDSATYLVKTNLSTETTPPPLALGQTVDTTYFATLAQLRQFLTLLWEGSVVGGAGYYVGTGSDLPASLFDADGYATLQILAIAGTQQQTAPAGRSLLKFNNCALIGPALDSSTHALFVESYDDSDMLGQALVPPGSVGFQLHTYRPGDEATPEQALRGLYSLLSFHLPVQAGNPYAVPASGMPIPPQPSDPGAPPLWQRERLLRRRLLQSHHDALDPRPRWDYTQVVPICRFGPASALPQVAGLPAAADDPYRGYGTASATQNADFQLGFADIFGNRSDPAGSASVAVDVGYTDPLIGIDGWPGVALAYRVEPAAEQTATLTVSIAPRPAVLMPSPSQAGAALAVAADRQARKYAEAYYQLGQSLSATIITTLKTDPAAGQLDVDVQALWQHAAASHVFASTAALLQAQRAPADISLASICENYNVRYTEMAAANADQPALQLFGAQPLQVPAYAIFALHDSATSIAATQRAAGWPRPAALALLRDDDNSAHPLRPGAVLSIDGKTFSTGANPGTLLALAAAHGTTPARLATENATVAMLAAGFVFSVEVDAGAFVAVTVFAGTTDTFKKVADAFAPQGVNLSPADLAETHAGKDHMLSPDIPLNSSVWIVRPDETLAQNGSGATLDRLTQLNVATPDLFDEGALIYLGVFENDLGVVPLAQQSLREFADAYACPMELLLRANADIALPEKTTLAIPGLIAWPAQPASLRVPYTLRASEVLNDLAGRFAYAAGVDDAGTQFALQNANMPLLLVGQQTITLHVGTDAVTITTPQGGESLAAALQQAQRRLSAATMADLAAAIGPMPGALQAGRLVLCPPARLPANATPEQWLTFYTVDTGLFALANTAVPSLIAPGLTLYADDGTTRLTTKPGDTFNSLIVRFGELGVQTDAAAIALAAKNQQTAFLAAGQPILLPPAVTRLTVNLGSGGAYPGPVFPLSVALRLERPKALIQQDFDAEGPVRRALAAIPAPGSEQGSGGQSSLTFTDFIDTLKKALKDLRVGTGKTAASQQDLWAVNFGSGGITQLKVYGGTTVAGQSNPQPRYFALKPLYPAPVTRGNVLIKSLTDQGSLSETTTATQYQSIDVEVWASRFLADVDRLLGANKATDFYLDATARAQLRSILKAKETLVDAITHDLAVILDISDARAADGLVKAREALRQQLGISLLSAYGTSTIVQFDGSVSSPWQTPGSLLLPANVYGQLTPTDATTDRNWTTTAAKTWLNDAAPFVTFLLTVSDPASHRNVAANLNYDIGYLETNVTGSGLPAGYKASDWLSFVPPLAGAQRPASVQTGLGQVVVPIPLRNFPPLPTVLGQTATSSAVDPAAAVLQRRRAAGARALGSVALARMPLWDYSFTYSHQHAEQDEVIISVQFNLQQLAAKAQVVPEDDLFTALAQYIAVADRLWTLLDAPATSRTVWQNATTAFATTIASVADRWTKRLPQISLLQADGMQPGSSYAFRARVTDRDTADGGREVDFLTLSSRSDGIGPDGKWPAVYARQADGSGTKLDPEAISATEMKYKVDRDKSVPASWPVFTLRWMELNVAEWQNATANVVVQRNERLLGDQGPATRTDFVFRTDVVYANNVVTPLNIWNERTQITGTPGSNYVETALTQAFATLFPEAFSPAATPLHISMGIAYAFELVLDPSDPERSMVAETPVALYPDKLLETDTAQILQEAVNIWKRNNQPAERAGEWVFSLTVYSSMESLKRPLLAIERLSLRLT